MADALVGYTGFVGSNLDRQHSFTDLYNSSNISEIAGRHFDSAVFSAAKAEKWRINQNPAADLEHIRELERHLSSFSADRLILVSTVDVYASPREVTELDAPRPKGLHPYGLHRLQLEQFARDHFADVLVVRLPGLFGRGLKKNVIFDLLHDNNVAAINPAGSFQYYNLADLWADICIATENDLALVNLATEPVETSTLAREVFGIELSPSDAPAPARYDMRSVHDRLFGGTDGYLRSRATVLEALNRFVQDERGRA